MGTTLGKTAIVRIPNKGVVKGKAVSMATALG
jgi:hypothetical protein